jgi:hypothetical protein
MLIFSLKFNFEFKIIIKIFLFSKIFKFLSIIGDWGLGICHNPQSPLIKNLINIGKLIDLK